MRIELTSAPAAEPITLAEAKAHLRVDDTSDDTLITALIVAARQAAEHETGRRLVTQRWTAYFDDFCALSLPDLSPVTSVVSVKYLATDGTLTTLASSECQLIKSAPALVVEAYGKTFPAVRADPEAVRIEVECGYGNAAAVPQAIKQWMLLQIGAMYEHRETVTEREPFRLPFADRLLDPYRVLTVG